MEDLAESCYTAKSQSLLSLWIKQTQKICSEQKSKYKNGALKLLRRC